MTTRVLDVCPSGWAPNLLDVAIRRVRVGWPATSYTARDTLVAAHTLPPETVAERFVELGTPLLPGRSDLVVARLCDTPDSGPTVEWVREVGEALRARRTDGVLGAVCLTPATCETETAVLAEGPYGFVIRLGELDRRTAADVVDALDVGIGSVHRLKGAYDGCEIDLSLARSAEPFEVASEIRGRTFAPLFGEDRPTTPDLCVIQAPSKHIEAVRDGVRPTPVLGTAVHPSIRVTGFREGR
jgi:hypothetical protein